MRRLIPIALELIGVIVIGGGIGIELATGAGIGHVLITSGSVLVAGGAIIWGKFIKRREK